MEIRQESMLTHNYKLPDILCSNSDTTIMKFLETLWSKWRGMIPDVFSVESSIA